MPVHRMIFRADLNGANYEILDGPGSVLRIMQNAGEGFFKQLQDSTPNRTILGTTGAVGDSETFRMSVSPLAIDFSYETAAGFDLEKFEAADTLRTLFKCAQDLTEHFKIKKLQRAGLRIYHLGSVGSGAIDLIPVFRKATHSPFVAAVEESVGKPTDYGVHFDGEKDALKYHLTFGPFRATEGERYFEAIHSQIKESQSKNMICDLDQYEEAFVQTVAWTVWTRTAVTRAGQLISRLNKVVGEHINAN